MLLLNLPDLHIPTFLHFYFDPRKSVFPMAHLRSRNNLAMLVAFFLQALMLVECNAGSKHPTSSHSSLLPPSVQMDIPESIAAISGGGARSRANTDSPSSDNIIGKVKDIFAYGAVESTSSSGVKVKGRGISNSASSVSVVNANERAFIMALVMTLASPYVAPITDEFYRSMNKGLKYSLQKAVDVGDEIIALMEDLGDEIVHLAKLTGAFFASSSMAVSAYIFSKIDATLAAIADLAYEIRLSVMDIVSPITGIVQKSYGSTVGASIGTAKFLSRVSVGGAKSIGRNSVSAAKSITQTTLNASRNTKNFVCMCGRETVWFVEDVLDFASDNIQAAASSGGKLMRATCRNFFSGIKKAAKCVSSCAKYTGSAIESAAILAKDECVSFTEYVVQCAVVGTETVCNFIASVARYTAITFVDGLEFTAMSFADGFEWTLFAILLAFSQISTFIKTVGKFLATSAVFCAEGTAKTASKTAKKIVNSIKYVRDEAPEWLLDFADAMPFLEIKENNDIALTKTAQSVIFLATTVVAFHPYFNEDEEIPTNKYGFTKAYETLKSRFFPSQRLLLLGALARGLHQQSSFAHTFQPSLGAGALMNAGAIFADERWFSFFVAGWFVSGQIWTLFGAQTPDTSSLCEGKVGVMEKKGWGWFEF